MKETLISSRPLCGIATFLALGIAQAQLVHEPFAYPGDTTWTAATPLPTGITSYTGTNASINAAAALTYPGLQSSGRGYGPLNGRSNMNLDLSPTSPLASLISGGLVGGTGTGTLYISWMLKGANGGSANTLELANSANADVSAAFGTVFSASGGYRLVSSTSAAGGSLQYQNSSVQPSVGVDFLVARIDFGPGITDNVSLFINQLSEGVPNVTSGPSRNVKFNRINFANFGGAQAMYDEVRIGLLYDDVAPAALVDPPAAPSSVVATTNSSTEITVTFTDNATTETGFTVERSPDGEFDWSPVGSLGVVTSGSGSFLDYSLAPDTTYYYRVTAFNPGGTSPESNTASATTSAPPPFVPLDTIYQPFEDASGTIGTAASPVTGISGYAANGPSGTILDTSALNYPGLSTSGNGLLGAQSARFLMTLDTTLPGLAPYVSGGLIGATNSGVLYVSWVTRDVSGQEANALDFENVTAAGEKTSVAIGTSFGNNFIRAMSANSLNGDIVNYSNSSIVASSSVTTRYVAKFTFNPGNTSTVQVFVNQLTEGTPDVGTTGFARFNRLGFTVYGDANATVPSVDEIRIGTSFAAVTPSGSASGLVGFRTANGLAADGSDDLLTPANDGVENLLKYAFNMIGTGTGQASSLGTSNVSVVGSSGSAGLPLVGQAGSGALTITYIRRRASSNPGITYTVKFSDSLASFAVNPSAVETPETIDTTFERVTVTDSTVSGKRFALVEVAAQ